jgi:hypothetical protein
MKQIPLTQGRIALVDDEDFDKLNNYKWRAHCHKGQDKTFYARRNLPREPGKSRKMEHMHRVILCIPDEYETDHIDRNGLNNQKGNLRIVTHRENCRNRITATSRYVGVSFHKSSKKWRASISIGGRSRYLGCSENEFDAATMYQVAIAVLVGVAGGGV